MPNRIYRKVDLSIWDDEKFIALDDDAKLTWLLLLTGPQTTSIPGLQLADGYTLASALRWSSDRVERALQQLTAAGMVQVDARLRVIRLPNAPSYNPPANPSVLVGYYREWQRLPQSKLKIDHVESIRAGVPFDTYTNLTGDHDKDMKGNFRFTWEHTFDTLSTGLSTDLSDTLSTGLSTSVISDQGSGISKKTPAAPAALELVPEGNKQTAKKPANETPRFDLASIYQAYPRKGDGKIKGLAHLERQIRSDADYAQLRAAVANFAAKVCAEGTELKFVPHFSTWANGKWRDYVDGAHIVAAGQAAVEPPRPKPYEKRYADEKESA